MTKYYTPLEKEFFPGIDGLRFDSDSAEVIESASR